MGKAGIGPIRLEPVYKKAIWAGERLKKIRGLQEDAMFWAFVAAEAYPKYRFTGNKGFLASTVAGTLASAASLGSFVISVLR